MNPQRTPIRSLVILVVSVILVASSIAAFVIYRTPFSRTIFPPAVATHPTLPAPTPTPSPTPSPTPTPSPAPTPTPIPTLATVPTSQILGIQADPQTSYPGIHWVRLGYPSCGWGNLKGSVLKKTVENYHQQGIRVLLTVCQGPNDSRLYDTGPLKDAAQGGADAVQCGNEEMKQDPSVAFLYIPPTNFARFYDLCEHAVHAVRSNIPVLLGSLDPHVGGVDYQPLVDQANYLNQMQYAMNNVVHPGGHWDWRTQTLGLIDSWHNGYPDASVNSLYGLFVFWAQQFRVDLNSGSLGKHLWVVEGTGCFKGCGINPDNDYQVAVSHILALITDVQTAMKYKVPFFFFTGKDFISAGYYWPIGVLDANGHPKPIRQDLPMGARSLVMFCSSQTVTVTNQEDLLARMYNGCSLPNNYVSILVS